MSVIRTLLFIIAIFFALVAHAQNALDNFDSLSLKWEQNASNAESIIERSTASDQIIADWRSRLVNDRESALTFLETYQPRVEELRTQIARIVSTLQDGEEPSEEVQTTLDQIRNDLNAIEAPVLEAQLAFERANKLILEFDALVRKRFTDNLLSRSSSPVWPSEIKRSTSALSDGGAKIYRDTVSMLKSKDLRGQIIDRLPLTLVLLLLGGTLYFVIKRQTSQKLNFEILLQKTTIGRSISGIVSSIFPLFIGWAGLTLIFNALLNSGIFGIIGHSTMALLRETSYASLIGWWIWQPSRQNSQMNPRLIRNQITLLTFIVALSWNIEPLVHILFFDPLNSSLSESVFSFLNLLFIAICVPIVWFLLRRKDFNYVIWQNHSVGFERTTRWIRNGINIGLLIAIFLAIVGYYSASRQLFHGLTLSFLGILFFLKVFFICNTSLQKLSNSEVANNDTGSEILIENSGVYSVILALLLFLLAIPFFLIFWGTSSTALNELWVRLNNGVSIGEFQISATNLFQILFVFALGYIIIRTIKRLLQNFILPKTKMDIGAQTAISSLFGYAGYTLTAFVAMNAAGLNLSNIAVVIGALSVGIGFGLQNIVSNFISGIILLIERPVKKGDWIVVNGQEGYVKKIAVRSTEIETFDRASVIVPNADLISQSVVNWVHSSKSARIRIPIGVSYDSDVELVKETLLEIGRKSPYALRFPDPVVFLIDFGASSINFELRFYIREADYMLSAISEVNFAIVEKFREANIDIPFPQTEVRLIKNSE